MEPEESRGELVLRCRCGELRGRLGLPAGGNRCVCHCRFCQAFAREFAVEAAVLDAHGGTDILQVPPSRLRFDDPSPLRSLTLSRNGPLRWYAGCCDTPMANTARGPGLPFVGVLVFGLTHDATPEAIDAALGPVRYRIYARGALGDRDGLDAHDGVPVGMLARVILAMVSNRLRGEHRRSPFFDGSGAPLATPRAATRAAPD